MNGGKQEITVYDENSLSGEALEKQAYLDETREFDEVDVEALVSGVDNGADGGAQPEAMEVTEEGEDNDDDDDEEIVDPSNLPLKVDMEVRGRYFCGAVYPQKFPHN